MSDETTKDLAFVEGLDSIILRINQLEKRVAGLEAFAEDRSRETRPMMGKVQSEILETRIETRESLYQQSQRIDLVEGKVNLLTVDLTDTRAAQNVLLSRILKETPYPDLAKMLREK